MPSLSCLRKRFILSGVSILCGLGLLQSSLIAGLIGDLESADGWQVNLGEEFPGATGMFTVRKEGETGIGVVTYDFTAGGQYIAVTTAGLEIAADHTEIQIKVKAATPQKLALRLGDATGQFHQVAIPYTKAESWQTLRASLSPLRAAFHFGGANDGVVHFPINEVWLIVDKPNGAKAGEIVFTEFQTLAPTVAAVTAPVVAVPPPATIGPLNFRMGVATHFGNGAHYIPNWKIEPCIRAAAELGVGWIRDDFHWKDYEKTKGRYVLPDRSRRWIEAANQAGLKIILILSGGNPLYENPYDPEAFARASAAVATELRGKIHAIEILNEPHNSGFAKHYGGTWNGYDAGTKTVQPWVAHYVTLLNAAATAIRAVDPSVKIIGLGSVPPVNFRQLALGIAPEVDGITEHPYSIRGVPELIPYAATESMVKRDGIATADGQGTYASLVRMYREESAKHKGPRELWMTEWGFASYQEAKPSFFAGVTREAQAKYALRRFVEDLGLGVEVSIWYALKDDGGNVYNAEDNFGLLTRANTPKPVYAAVQRLARLLQPYAPMQPAPEVAVFTQNTRSDTYPIAWDGARLAAPGSVKSHAFARPDGARPLLVLWTAERANGELQARVADVEIKADWTVKQVRVLDLLTGDTRVLTAERRGDRVWVPQLSVPDYPIVLEF